MKRTTLEDIGKVLGVSKVAVHKALSGKDGVSAKLKDEIIKTAHEMGYKKFRNSGISGMNFVYAIKKRFFLTAYEQLYSPIYYYLNKECENLKAKLQIVFLEDSGNNIAIIDNIIHNSKPKINGIFFAGEADKDIMKHLELVDIPFLFIDYYSSLFNYNYLYVENYQLSYSITHYLVLHGHKNIGFVGDINAASAITDRFLGYKKALIENGINCNEKWHINKNIEHISDISNLVPANPPTAFICHCDLAAYKLYTALNIKGLTVPDDVSVISFDNTALCESISPTLTSAGISKEYIAKKAFTVMTDILSNRTKAVTISLKPKLYERNSVKDINLNI